jgi:hypothetical protein
MVATGQILLLDRFHQQLVAVAAAAMIQQLLMHTVDEQAAQAVVHLIRTQQVLLVQVRWAKVIMAAQQAVQQSLIAEAVAAVLGLLAFQAQPLGMVELVQLG